MLNKYSRGFMGVASLAAVISLAACGSQGEGEAEVAEAAAPAAEAPLPVIPTGSGTRSGLSQEAWDSNPDTMRWQNVAYEIAGDDPDLIYDAGVFCNPGRGVTAEHRRTTGTSQEYLPDSEPFLEPFPMPDQAEVVGIQRLFDNFYWIGNTSIGLWLVTSDDGYIMYDTMNHAADARDVIVPAMEEAGLDPTQIKYLVFGHYHGDHVGGGRYLQRISGAQAIMHWADWELYMQRFEEEGGTGGFVRGEMVATEDDLTPMTRDIDATDGMQITVGDVTAEIYHMTGHTPGSLGMIVPVKYQGEEHPILLVTAGNHFTNIEAFIGGYEHIWDIAIERGVESVMQSHPNTNMNLLARTTYVDENYPPEMNPLLYGAERTERYLNIVRACSRAWIEAVDMF